MLILKKTSKKIIECYIKSDVKDYLINLLESETILKNSKINLKVLLLIFNKI